MDYIYSDPFVQFYKDRMVEHHMFYYFQNLFTQEELGYITEWGEINDLYDGEVGGGLDGLHIVPEIRKSKISWIDIQDDTKWIFDRLALASLEANVEMNWNFDLIGFGDTLQYTKYDGEDKGHYSWHADIGQGVSHRKLSIIVQLSDEDEYEGGNVELKVGSRDIVLPKTKGSVVVFPSFVLHRVLPVTSGIRKSLVAWISGPNFK
jgi:PKHD-type hydroxylase